MRGNLGRQLSASQGRLTPYYGDGTKGAGMYPETSPISDEPGRVTPSAGAPGAAGATPSAGAPGAAGATPAAQAGADAQPAATDTGGWPVVSDATQDVRFAVAMSGGVSLAVWMGGVARAVNLLQQASNLRLNENGGDAPGQRQTRPARQRRAAPAPLTGTRSPATCT